MPSSQKSENFQHADLLREIAELKQFGESLKSEVIVTPLIDVVSDVLDLPDNLDGLDERKIHDIRSRVEECRRTMDDFGYSYVRRIITRPEQSDVFKIVNQSDLFAKELKRMIGKKVTLENGEEIVITKAVCDALTRFRFSIGTPPITPKGIQAIEQMIFGSGLSDIYQFRELLGGGAATRYLFDGFIANVDRLVNQSTHYTSTEERRQFEKKSTDFNNFEGLRGLKKSVISGTAKTAIRLIKEELFSRHGQGGEHPVEVVTGMDRLNGALIKRMKEKKETIFVVRVSKVPHHLITSDKLEKKWHGILGRLILVQDSENSRRASNTQVYSLFPDITDTLNVIHVKDSGTPANTQMNLRSIIENFSPEALHGLELRVRTKMAEYEGRGATSESAEEVREQEWKVTAQKDYLALKKFLQFIEFIKKIQTADETQLAAIQQELIARNEKLAMEYFFKKLKGKGYELVSVPQGGGRKEIGHVGKFLSRKFEQKLAHFDKTSTRKKLEDLKKDQGIPFTPAEKYSRETAGLQNRSPNAALREPGANTSYVMAKLEEKLRRLERQGIQGAGSLLARLKASLDKATASNIGGIARARISRLLGTAGIGSASKMMERGKPEALGQLIKDALGLIRRHAGGGLDELESLVDGLEAETGFKDLTLAEQLLNDIENGSLKPNLALSEVGWTFDDVLDEDDFPASNYLKIKLSENGELDADSLEKQIKNVKRSLRKFPELFELFCASTILIINDPHNPTSRVMRNETKFKLLQIASEYGLTILSDDAYHKQVSKEMKQLQLDHTLAEYYERHKSRFPKPVTIYSTLPTTKWAMGAGERTGTVLSNDQDRVNGQNFAEFIRTNTDAVNTMSLYMDAEKYDIGLKVKSICKKLEPASLFPSDILPAGLADDTADILDGILADDFANLKADDFSAPLYFTLIEARNGLERLRIRSASPLDILRYTSNLIARLKDFRLDKQTAKDSAKRSEVVADAIRRVAEDHPFLKQTAMVPEGPFYDCTRLDDGPEDPALKPFLLAIARARNIAVVPTKKGYARFSFGSELDGSSNDYENLSTAIEVDLRILIEYWEKFKRERAALHEAKDGNPALNAIKRLFPGGEVEILRTIQEKKVLVDQLLAKPGSKRKQLVFDRPANVAPNISSIEPDSVSNIVTLSSIKCANFREFINSRQFSDLFNYYLLKIQTKIPALQQLEDTDVVALYGARQFAEKEKSRMFKDKEREVFGQIATEIAKIWFSDSTVKILASTSEDSSVTALLGEEKKLGNYIRAFLDVFLTPDEQRALIKSIRTVDPKVEKYLPVEVGYPATLQAGYKELDGIKPHSSLPSWLRKMIGGGKFAANSTATDPAPMLSTPGKARVPGVDRAILQRDGDGKEAPSKEFFQERLEKFAEVMDSKEYVMKMVQIGGQKVLMIMNRSYSHYMVEELRLFPQTDLTPDDLANCKPDCVSFLGLPTKVFGEDYRIGYFFDSTVDGESVPVSWVDAESITDYMGYLKKPILTVANEKAEEKEMKSIHGSAFSIIFKNGLRKTIVLAGDSGTGKSETAIAMIKQIINNEDLAAQVEGIEFLSGDMLTLFEGNKVNKGKDGEMYGELYMLGTEQGDFMRMSDIPEDWEERVRDRINNGSKTNLSDKSNPRITIGNLCDPVEFMKPVCVNVFKSINNYEVPAASSVVESPSPKNLLLGEYMDGYRGEKGTSGDQPNIFASVRKSKDLSKDEIIAEYGRELDKLLGWDILTGPSGKADNAFLSFRDVRGGAAKAQSMVDSLFLGRKIADREIISTRYDCLENHYYVTLRGQEKDEEEVILDRNGIFNKVYNPIAATPGGHPFTNSERMGAKLERFAEVMRKAGVITGTLYTQLKVPDMERDGPAKAAQDLLKFLLEDERVNARFQEHIRQVDDDLREKYGAEILNSSTIPEDLMAHNLFILERHKSDNVYPIDSKGNRITLETPHYKYDPNKAKLPFNPSIITPAISAVILDVCDNPEYDKFSLQSFRFKLPQYNHIQAWDTKAELIYQVLIKNGLARLNYTETNIAQIPPKEVKKAEKIAEAIMSSRQSRPVPEKAARAA